MINYREQENDSKQFKKSYLDGLENIILKRQEESEKKRKALAPELIERQEFFREKLKTLLGWPLVGYQSQGEPKVKKTLLVEESEVRIFRMQIEVLDGLEMTGLYFENKSAEKSPLVLVQHGGQGTPELISGFYDDTYNYNQMLSRVLSQGVHVFALQLLLWDEKYDVPFDRVKTDSRLKRVGSSITAIEVFGLQRAIDYFEKQGNVSSIGMVGLSYGGFYTLFTTAIDTRIKSAISCAFFNTRDKHPWSDWTWFDFADYFDDAEVASLIYPRKFCIEIAKSDELFICEDGIKSYEKLKSIFGEKLDEWLTFITFEGSHEFCKDDQPIIDLINDLK